MFDSRGFSAILDGMIKDIQSSGGQILLNKKVSVINYTESGANLEITDTFTGTPETLSGDAVAVTVSVGVLKSKRLAFAPPLPDWKL